MLPDGVIMLFSSLIFLWVFLPFVFIGSFILQKFGGMKAANILLLISSLLFYAWGEPIYILLMLASILINYSAGMLLYTKHKFCGRFPKIIWTRRTTKTEFYRSLQRFRGQVRGTLSQDCRHTLTIACHSKTSWLP